MDTFFRRHFKRKEDTSPGETDPTRQRRPSVAVPTSKARRRSNVGLASTTLCQRRRSSVQLQGEMCAGGSRLASHLRGGPGRRRSSTTTPSLNPKFAVRRRKLGKLRTIDTHLLGPSMLLASLLQMTDEGEGLHGEQQVEVRGLQSDGDDNSCSDYDSQSEDSQLSEAKELPEEDDQSETTEQPLSSSPSFSLDVTGTPRQTPPTSPQATPISRPTPSPSSRPLIRAPRCLRRNSSQVFAGDSALCCRHRGSSQRKRRRISTISKAGSPWPGRGLPLPNNRRSSVYHMHHPAFYRGPGALSPMGAYDSRLESWSAFLLYVAPQNKYQNMLQITFDLMRAVQ